MSGGSSFVIDSYHDRPYKPDELREQYDNREELTWKEKLKLMWRRDNYGNLSPELEFVYGATKISFILGFVTGAYQDSKEVFTKFMEQNKQTMFKHPREAQAILQEQVTYHMLKGGLRKGLKTGIVVTSYVALCQTAHAIRNYVNPLDHIACGFTLGGMYRFMGGPKAMLGSGFLGGSMGLIDGVCTWSLYKLSGESISERWARELESIHNQNIAEDEKARELRLNLRREERLSREEWMQKQVEDLAEGEKESPPMVQKVLQLAKKAFGPNSIDLLVDKGNDSVDIEDQTHNTTTKIFVTTDRDISPDVQETSVDIKDIKDKSEKTNLPSEPS